jgi:hypothetical protein
MTLAGLTLYGGGARPSRPWSTKGILVPAAIL